MEQATGFSFPTAAPASDHGNAEIWRRLWLMQEQILDLQRNQMQHQAAISKQLESIKDILSQAKGGWRAFIFFGTALSTAAAGVAWVYLNFFHIK